MNIAIFSWRDLKHPNAGGAELSTHEHAKAWVSTGHRVFWFASTFAGAKGSEVIDAVEIIREGNQVFWVQVAAFIWYFLGEHPPLDLVVDQFHGIPFFTPLYVRAKKLGFIHEVAKEVWRFNPWPKPFNLIPTLVGTLLEPWVFKTFYKKIPFMSVSFSTRDDLVTWGIPEKNISVVHNGVSLNLPNPIPSKEKKKTAMFLGAVSEDKGIRDALLAFSEINKKEKNWQFWIVGRADLKYKNLIKDLSKQLGIDKKLKYLGFVSDKKKFELLARAHVLVNTSIHEGWGLVNIEANSVGTPVVGYNVHGVKDSVKNGETGVLVSFGDYRSLTENAIKLVNNHKIYREFQKNCKKWASKFLWQEATKGSLRLIESL